MPCCKKTKKLRQKRLAEQKVMRQLVQNPKWQAVRRSLVGTWKEKPEWACNQLKQFLGQISKTSDDKLRIVMNYLTGSGFRMGKISHPCIASLRTQISMEMRKRKAKG